MTRAQLQQLLERGRRRGWRAVVLLRLWRTQPQLVGRQVRHVLRPSDHRPLFVGGESFARELKRTAGRHYEHNLAVRREEP